MKILEIQSNAFEMVCFVLTQSVIFIFFIEINVFFLLLKIQGFAFLVMQTAVPINFCLQLEEAELSIHLSFGRLLKSKKRNNKTKWRSKQIQKKKLQ